MNGQSVLPVQKSETLVHSASIVFAVALSNVLSQLQDSCRRLYNRGEGRKKMEAFMKEADKSNREW